MGYRDVFVICCQLCGMSHFKLSCELLSTSGGGLVPDNTWIQERGEESLFVDMEKQSDVGAMKIKTNVTSGFK